MCFHKLPHSFIVYKKVGWKNFFGFYLERGELELSYFRSLWSAGSRCFELTYFLENNTRNVEINFFYFERKDEASVRSVLFIFVQQYIATKDRQAMKMASSRNGSDRRNE